MTGPFLYKWSIVIHNTNVENTTKGNIYYQEHDQNVNLDLQLNMHIPSLQGPSWLWLYGSWIHNCLCNQCLSPLKLWVRIPLMTRCTRYNIMWNSLSVTTPVSSTNKTDFNDITEILLKVALNTITLSLLCNVFVEINTNLSCLLV